MLSYTRLESTVLKHEALSDYILARDADRSKAVQAPVAPAYQPAVSVKKSVTPDAIISLIDGKPYKSLKRHLTGHGLTPDQYRERYGLPRDYPLVAASYTARRSELTKSAGLGQQRRKTAPKSAATSEAVGEIPSKKRARKKA